MRVIVSLSGKCHGGLNGSIALVGDMRVWMVKQRSVC